MFVDLMFICMKYEFKYYYILINIFHFYLKLNNFRFR